ncbi:MAG: response regulator [Anaerolineae bacterium]|nr:response regulator [Anaerolineae bacterium]
MSSHRQAERPITILMVEDNPGDVRLTIEALKENAIDHALYVAKDGIEALAFLRHEGAFANAPQPDLILLDINLPRKNGLEVLEVIKTDPASKHIPVVVLTTSSSEDDIRRAYDRHANCYITKPIDVWEFFDVVKSIKEFWQRIAQLPPSGNETLITG